MPAIALIAVLLAACTHATWNLVAKRAADSRYFVWLYSIGSLLVWSPAVAWVLWTTRPNFGALQWVAVGATGILHLAYSLGLQAGYRAADLSVVYSVARGSGPLLSFVGAAILLGERPGPLAILGLALVVLGIVLVAGLARKLPRGSARGFRWGLITGSCVAAYTLNDGWAVKVLAISPILLDYAGNSFRALVLTRWAIRDRPRLAAEIREYARPALVVSVLGPLGYILVLFAMKVAPVSHVAPARELATLLGTYLGARMLNEPASGARLAGALCIVGGVVSLALSSG